MSGKFLLDTNILIALFSGDTSVQMHLEHIDDFASNITVLSCDSNTAHKYGLIKNSLLEKGKPIPENDVWIAAIALRHDLIIATRDDHFNKVEILKCEAW